MTEALSLLLIIGGCYLIGQGIYQSGKSIGSRKGFHVGRCIGSRPRRR